MTKSIDVDRAIVEGGARRAWCADRRDARSVKTERAEADEEKIYASKEDTRRATVLGRALIAPLSAGVEAY